MRRLFIFVAAMLLALGVGITGLPDATVDVGTAGIEVAVDAPEVEQAAAHTYGWRYVCTNNYSYYGGAGWIYYWAHVNVQWGFDRHEYVAYWMTYDQWMYYCYLGIW